MVHVLESNLESKYGEVIVNSGIGPHTPYFFEFAICILKFRKGSDVKSYKRKGFIFLSGSKVD
jgi:hypothetical protein